MRNSCAFSVGKNKLHQLRGVSVLDLDYINEFKKIYVLSILKEEGSYRQAARKLGVTSSAISQSITSLEKAMGKSLVIRDRNSIRVTEEAETLLVKSAPAFDAMKGVLNKEKSYEIARLDLGTYESIASDILPGVLTDLRRDHAGIKLNFTIGRTSTLLQKIRTGELCTAIVIDSEELDHFSKEFIVQDEFAIYIAKKFFKKDSLAEIYQQLGLGSISASGQGHPRYYQKYLDSLHKTFKPTIFSDSLEVLKGLTAQGLIMSILPKRIGSRDVDLMDISKHVKIKNDERGIHHIVLAYQGKCDKHEAIYLAKLAGKYI